MHKWNELRFVESCGHDCEFYFATVPKPIVARICIYELEDILPRSTFIRCEKSFIIHYIIFSEAGLDGNILTYDNHEITITRELVEPIYEHSKLYHAQIRPLYLKFEADAKEFFLNNQPPNDFFAK